MPFQSRYKSTCIHCGKAIEIGQLISWSRKTRGAWHVSCNTPNASADSTPTTAQAETTPTQAPVQSHDALEALANAMQPYIKATVNAEQVNEMIDKALAGFNPDHVLTIEYKRFDGTVKTIEGAHSEMPKLMYLVSKRHHVYLYGAPGSGKSHASKQVADAIGVPYGFISLNPQTPDSRLLGFIDANGNYRSTLFHDIYQNGGVFCIDEVDNASPSLLTTLNSALENGHMAFPNGLVAKHPDFVLIATGNTCGKGANPMFPERRPFDAAFAERFTFIAWDYDIALEKAITLSINPNADSWHRWVIGTREYCKQHYPKVLVTPRASYKGAEYLIDSGFSYAQISDMLIFKGLDTATREAILTNNPFPRG